MSNPYDKEYMDRHLSDFYAFEAAVRSHDIGHSLERDDVVVLYTVMRREK